MRGVSISSLQGCDFTSLYRTYISAFSDYFVPYHISEEQLEVSLQQVVYDPTLSFGAFERSGRMVGFWLTAFDAPSNISKAYGVGTGVVPEERRSSIATKLLSALEREASRRGIKWYSLDVDRENTSAMEFYAKCGFDLSGVHYSYCANGEFDETQSMVEGFVLREISLGELSEVYQDYLEYQPSWENTLHAMIRMGRFARAFLVEGGREIFGYGIFQPARSRISQIGILEGQHTALATRTLLHGLSEMVTSSDPLHITSVPETAQRTIVMLEEAGFVQVGEQLEMVKRFR